MVSLKLGQTVKTLKAQPRQIKQVQTTQISDEHAVDVFSRYFLAAYFNQRDQANQRDLYNDLCLWS